MPKLSQKEFAELASTMPGASDEEILARAKQAEVAAPRESKQSWWEWLNTPLVKESSIPIEDDDWAITRAAKTINNAVGELGRYALTTPMGIATTVASMGTAPLARAGMLGAAKTARAIDTALQVPYIAEGGKNIYQGVRDENLPQAAAGALEATLGGAGLRGAMRQPVAEVLPARRPNPAPIERPGYTTPAEFNDRQKFYDWAVARNRGEAVSDFPPVVPHQSDLGDVWQLAKQEGQRPPLPAELAAVREANEWTTPEIFLNEQHSPLVTGKRYSILSAANPNRQTLSMPENLQRQAALEAEIRAKGFNPIPAQGMFDAPEPSFLVPDLPAKDATEFGRKYGQHSVITDQGLHRIEDERLFPRTGLKFDQNVDNYYTELMLPNGQRTKFQLNFPDEAFGPAEMLEFEHRTAVPDLALLDPARMARGFEKRGVSGLERKRNERYPDFFVNRSYGTVKGGLLEPDVAALPHVYEGKVPAHQVYDGIADPLGLHEKAAEKALVVAQERGLYATPELQATVFERMVKDAGYRGLRFPTGNKVPAADSLMLFDQTPVQLRKLEAPAASGTLAVVRPSSLADLEDSTKGMSLEVLDEPIAVNASGESAASAEALSRQAGMQARGEQFAVMKGGTIRPLIGPEAVDYVPQKGETFGVIKNGRFSPLSTASAIVGPTAAMAVPDDPDSDWDDALRIGLTGAGAVGMAARLFPKGLKKELDVVAAAARRELGAGKDALIKTRLRDYVNQNVAKSAGEAADINAMYWTRALPRYNGIDYDVRKPLGKLLKKAKDGGVEFNTFSKSRVMMAYEVGKNNTSWEDQRWLYHATNGEPEAAVQFSRLLGTLSLENTTNENTLQAVEAFIRAADGEAPDQIVNNLLHGFKNKPAATDNLQRAVAGGRIFADKVESMAGSVIGEHQVLPVDRWLMRLIGVNRDKTPGKMDYKLISQAVTKAAEEAGEASPFAFMAKAWSGMQKIAKSETPSYSEAFSHMQLPEPMTTPSMKKAFFENYPEIEANAISGTGGYQPLAQNPRLSYEEWLDQTRALYRAGLDAGDVLGKKVPPKAERIPTLEALRKREARSYATPPKVR